jgi:prepilin-type N-terminal cleavage/methylation domain-containing protein
MPSAGSTQTGCVQTTGARRGFTLIELLAVVIILAILAGVAIPKFINYQDQAREAACKGTLSGVRAAMANFLVNTTISGTPAYPAFAEIDVPGTVIQEAIPANPYTGKTGMNLLGVGDASVRTVIANNKGWCYYVKNVPQPPAAVFWPNSNTVGENTW